MFGTFLAYPFGEKQVVSSGPVDTLQPAKQITVISSLLQPSKDKSAKLK
jgi:hypothetical protein